MTAAAGVTYPAAYTAQQSHLESGNTQLPHEVGNADWLLLWHT